MSMDDKIKAAAKNVEGKMQEATGEITGDNTMKAEGKLKQAQAAAMNISEDIKEKAQDLIDDLKNVHIKEKAQNLVDDIKNIDIKEKAQDLVDDIKNIDIKEKTQDLVDDIKNVANNVIDKIKNKIE